MPGMKKRVYATKKKSYAKRKAPEDRVEWRAKKPRTQTLGKITGKVDANATTLAKCDGPFSNVKYTTLVYENGLTAMANNASYFSANIVCNGAFDVDNNLGAYFGNKQPLYFDSLLSASGPYKQYKVISWKTTYTLINNTAVPINAYFWPSVYAASEVDSPTENENMPGIQRRYLTAKGDQESKCVVTVRGHVDDIYPGITDGLNGTYGANPVNQIFGGLLVSSADGSTIASCYVAIKHEMYTELEVVDALVS